MRIQVFLLAACCLLMPVTPSHAQSNTSPENAVQTPTQKCERLASLELPNASIATAKAIEAGAFVGPPQAFTGRDLSAFYKKLPPFCRVVAHARPTSDSDIEIELWMPLAGWNSKLQGLGNGGFAGLIDTYGLGAGVAMGYAAVATDTGHKGSPIDAAWALGHPEKVIDFGHRGIHEMTRVAKLVVQQFYGSSARRSYFAGCSDGGREALMEAQRYPEDYDGILAGAPANNWTDLFALAGYDTQVLTAAPGAFIPQAKIPTIAKAVDAACDKMDGVADGILNDPRQCHFDPASIQCKSGEDANTCLTAPQAEALEKIYAGIQDAKGSQIFPGYLPGAEEGLGGWGTWITGPAPGRSVMAFFAIGYFSDFVYAKPDWSYKSFSLDTDLAAAKQKTAAALDAVNPDLTAFSKRGGKLILYHGWNDPAIPALSTVNYYGDVIAKMGQSNADSFVRLYMLPGVQHCGGGTGPEIEGPGAWTHIDAQHNARKALEGWVEKGMAPGALIATKTAGDTPPATVTMSRPLCPYPQSAQYKGSGDPNSAENFECTMPKR